MINTTKAEGWISRLASDQSVVSDPNRGVSDAFGSLISKGNPPLHLVLDGLAKGYEENDEMASQYLCTVLSTLVKYLGAAGTLILIVLGVYQAIQALKTAGSAILSALKMVYDLLGGAWSGVGSIADAIFGKARADAASTASLNMLELAFTAALPGPLSLIKTAMGGSMITASVTPTSPGPTPPAGAPAPSNITPAGTGGGANNSTLAAAIVDAVAGLLGGMSDNQRRVAYDSAIKGIKRGVAPNQIITRLRDTLQQSR